MKLIEEFFPDDKTMRSELAGLFTQGRHLGLPLLMGEGYPIMCSWVNAGQE